MRISDVMTRHVITAKPEMPIAEAVQLMLQHRISGLPVVDGEGRLVGVVTEGDFLRRAETGTQRRHARWLELLLGPGRLAGEFVQAHGRKVGEIMSREPVTAREDMPLATAVALMERRRVKRLPVLRDGSLVGIVTRANLLRALAGVLAHPGPVPPGDSAIRERILAVLERQPWAPRSSIDVQVRAGVVELWGVIFDEREREALRVAAENVPGVREVRDHLAWVEPYSGTVIEDPEPRRGAEAR
jgi:CBS domain-containing protein